MQRQQFRPAQVQLNPGDLYVGRPGPMTEPKYVPRRADFKLGRGQTPRLTAGISRAESIVRGDDLRDLSSMFRREKQGNWDLVTEESFNANMFYES